MIEIEYKNSYLSQNGSARKHPFPIDTQLGSARYTRYSSAKNLNLKTIHWLQIVHVRQVFNLKKNIFYSDY